MNDPDRTIENLLAGLRDAEPSPGMHRRLLDVMVSGQAAPGNARWRLRPVFACALAIAVSLAAWVHYHWQTPRNVTTYTRNMEAQGPIALPMTAHRTTTEPRRKANRVPLKPASAHEAADGEEAQSVSFPAPPLPLTDQEKLLLRIAHRNDARDKNLLEPNLQAQQSAKATQQFQQFFEMNAEEMRSESE